MDQLDSALIAVQKLEKKLRQLVNRGDSTAAQLELAKEALDLLRKLALSRGEKPADIDSRAEQARAREARRKGAAQ